MKREPREVVMKLVGVGAMASPRYAPAGLLVAFDGHRVMIDGGPGAAPRGRVDAWLVTDAQAELIAAIRRLARARGIEPAVAAYEAAGVRIAPRRVVHTSHPAHGYLVEATGPRRLRCAWAPEFFAFPRWAAGVDLLFAEASSYARPVLFRGGVGGHMAALDVARAARRSEVKRLVFAHIGRSSIRARDAGAPLPFGEWGSDGDVFVVPR
jgi:hypothetical protein